MDLQKLSPEFAADLEALQALRLDVGARNRALTLRELKRHILKEEIFNELRALGRTKTDAEDGIKAQRRYQDYELETARLVFERDRLMAEAEAKRLGLLAFIQLQAVVA